MFAYQTYLKMRTELRNTDWLMVAKGNRNILINGQFHGTPDVGRNR
jgi:hypothetical protein